MVVAALAIVTSASAQLEGTTISFEPAGKKTAEGLSINKNLVAYLAFSDEQASEGTHSLKVTFTPDELEPKGVNFRMGSADKGFTLAKGSHNISFKLYRADDNAPNFKFVFYGGEKPTAVMVKSASYESGKWVDVSLDFELGFDFNSTISLVTPKAKYTENSAYYIDQLTIK